MWYNYLRKRVHDPTTCASRPSCPKNLKVKEKMGHTKFWEKSWIKEWNFKKFELNKIWKKMEKSWKKILEKKLKKEVGKKIEIKKFGKKIFWNKNIYKIQYKILK